MTSQISFDAFREQWLKPVYDGAPSPVDAERRFALKLFSQWRDIGHLADDVIYLAGVQDHNIDLIYIERGESDDEAIIGETWYIVQSILCATPIDPKGLTKAAQRAIDTLDNASALSATPSAPPAQRLAQFRQRAGSGADGDRVMLIIATELPLDEQAKQAIDDIRADGRARLGPIFDVEAVSIETIYLYKRFADALTLYLEQQSTADIKLERKLAWEAFGKFLDEDLGTATSIGEASGSALPASAESAADRALSPASPVNNGGQRLSTAKEQRRQFEAALEYYLKQSNVQPNPNSDWLKVAFQKYYQVRQEPRHFNKLSMGEYIDLFFRECWGRCGEVFDFDRDVVDRVLSSVRQIRNLLAHFREEEITDEHRRNLRLAAEWLPQYERAALAKLDEIAPLVPGAETATTVLSTSDTVTL